MKPETQRDERLTASENRNKMYEIFRTNLRLLRHYRDLSAVDMANELDSPTFKRGKRIIDLEYGRSNPTTEELMTFCKYFKVSLSDLMQREIKLSFVDEVNSVAYIVMKPEVYKSSI